MKNKPITPIAIIGSIIMVVTAVLFFTLTRRPTDVQWISFIFLLLAEGIAIGGSIALSKYAGHTEKTMIIAGVSALIWIYTGISMLISLIFITGAFRSVKAIVNFQLIILAIAAIIALLLITATKSVSEKNKATLQAVAQIKQIQDDVFMLMSDERNKAHKGKLEKIYEAIRYCDNATYAPADDKIALKVMELETALQEVDSNDESKVEGLLNEILLLTKKRTLEVQNMKAGGI